MAERIGSLGVWSFTGEIVDEPITDFTEPASLAAAVKVRMALDWARMMAQDDLLLRRHRTVGAGWQWSLDYRNKTQDFVPEPRTDDGARALAAELDFLTDDELVMVAHQRFDDDEAERFEELADKQQDDGLTPGEQHELARLTAKDQRMMLLKSRAMALLHQRGKALSVR